MKQCKYFRNIFCLLMYHGSCRNSYTSFFLNCDLIFTNQYMYYFLEWNTEMQTLKFIFCSILIFHKLHILIFSINQTKKNQQKNVYKIQMI